jgi:hypothetical protein
MGTAGRSAPLRRTGSLLALLGAELTAVLALHWLGRFPGLRIRWDEPVPWLLSSPVQEVLGALLRAVALVMAYWLLVSTVIYLLASLSRLPSAVRAVAWATFPLARRVADHAVAVTLATSMVGTTTLGVANPALAADDRGRAGPPARKPVAAAQAAPVRALGAQDTTTTRQPEYVPKVGGGDSTDTSAEETTPSTTTTTAPKPTKTSGRAYEFSAPEETTTTKPKASSRSTTSGSTTTTGESTTTTSESTTTTSESTTTTNPTTTSRETTTSESTTTSKPTTTTAATTSTTESTTTTTAAPTTTTTTAATTTTGATTTTAGARQGAAATTSTTGLRPPAYEFTPATPSTPEDKGSKGGGDSGSEDEGKDGGDSGSEQEATQQVVRGDNLWVIAREHLSQQRSDGAGAPTNREVAEYWQKVIDANRGRLRSGDPDLIYPGEEIILPPLE